MAGESIHACRGAMHGATTVAGVTHFRITPTTVKSQDSGGAASPGISDIAVTKKGVKVSLFGNDYQALLALVGVAAANFVGQTVGLAGAAEKHTVKNVVFADTPGAVDAKDPGMPGDIGNFQIDGDALWGTSDTFATMITAAADV